MCYMLRKIQVIRISFLIGMFLCTTCLRAMVCKFDNGWAYEEAEADRLVATLKQIKNEIPVGADRSEVEIRFRDIFQSGWYDQVKQEKLSEKDLQMMSFAWSQVCFNESKDPKKGIDRSISLINKNKIKGRGISINCRAPGLLSRLWSGKKQSKTPEGEMLNRTWVVAPY